MATTILVLTLVIAAQHFAFLYLEMFLWTKPAGRKVFGLSKDDANKTKVLAANQGLYNGFLSAGLIWGAFFSNPLFSESISVFFLSCVFVAGIYGGLTVKKSILFIQALPATLALILIFIK